jgi:hypothetical protein
VAKFDEGAWITVFAIPGLILLMSAVHRHYEMISRETECRRPANLKNIVPPIVVVPLERWSKVADKALRFAYKLSQQVLVLHVVPEDPLEVGTKDPLTSVWDEFIEKPALLAGYKPPELVVLNSPFRLVITPIYQYILEVERQHPDRWISVLVPELVERRWYYFLLHNQRANALKVILYAKGNGRIIVVNVPWYLRQ